MSPSGAASSRWSRPCETPSARMSKSCSRCTAASRRCRPSRSRSCSGPTGSAGSRSRCRRKTSPRSGACASNFRAMTIATGERIHARHEFRELFELRAADVVQFDVTHIGGLLESKKLAAQADVHYVTVAPHNVGGQISTAANLHLAACTTNFRVQEYFNDFADPWVKDTAPPDVHRSSMATSRFPPLRASVWSWTRRSAPRTRWARRTSTSSRRDGKSARARGASSGRRPELRRLSARDAQRLPTIAPQVLRRARRSVRCESPCGSGSGTPPPVP